MTRGGRGEPGDGIPDGYRDILLPIRPGAGYAGVAFPVAHAFLAR